MQEQTDHSAYIEEQRAWLIAYREQTGESWSIVAKGTGLKAGTISNFGSTNGYNGKKQETELPLAKAVERYRQSLAQRAALSSEITPVPGFFATETTDALERMMGFAQLGEMVAAALEAGCGKSSAARNYKACYPNVIYVEVPKSAGAPNNLLKLILAELGVSKPQGGTYDMSKQVCDLLRRASNPLLIIDEAQHLNEASLEEIRSWYDKFAGERNANFGVALLGNIGVMQKLGRHAQLYSRLSLKHVQIHPTPADIEALSDAWIITDPLIRAELQKICGRQGGLRNGTKALRLARMISDNEGRVLDIQHLRGAWRELEVRPAVAA